MAAAAANAAPNIWHFHDCIVLIRRFWDTSSRKSGRFPFEDPERSAGLFYNKESLLCSPALKIKDFNSWCSRLVAPPLHSAPCWEEPGCTPAAPAGGHTVAPHTHSCSRARVCVRSETKQSLLSKGSGFLLESLLLLLQS